MAMKDKIEVLGLNPLNLSGCLAYLKPRLPQAHKNDYGHVLVVGGDYGIGGAACLASLAALRSGAGIVTIATRPEHAYAFTAIHPELMCYGIKKPDDMNELLKRATVVAIGPGLGQNAWGEALLSKALVSSLPLIVDADALNILAKKPHYRENWILTPHPGECARLLHTTTDAIQKDRVSAIQSLKKRFEGVIVLKGAGTLILGHSDIPNICMVGNSGLAIPGSGDLLTGIIAALVAQNLSLQEAAMLGVLVHATAGDNAAVIGKRGLIAQDLLEGIRACLNT